MRPTLFPALRYKNARAAIDWLIQAFGFQSHAEHAGPGDTIAHAELRLGASTIGISTATGPTPANPWTNVRQGIYVVVKDIDAHHDRAKAAGAEIVMPLTDQPYGSREYGARDIDGHLWGFGTYDMAAADGEPTMFPEVVYRDARKAVKQLAEAFAFKQTLEVPRSDGSILHAELSSGDGVVMVGQHEAESQGPSVSEAICVYVADPDAHFRRAKAGGATITTEPYYTPFGARQYITRDLEDFVWLFGTYKPKPA